MNRTRTFLRSALLFALQVLLGRCQIPVDPNLFPSSPPLDTPVPSVTATRLPTSTATPSPTPIVTPTLTQTPRPTATPMGGGEDVFFDVYDTNSQHLGIFRFNVVTGESSLVSGPEMYLVGMSPNRDYLLGIADQTSLDQPTNLYFIQIVDGSSTVIANDAAHRFYNHPPAYWYPNGMIAYVGLGNVYNMLNAVRQDGNNRMLLAPEGDQVLWILPSSGNKGACWTAGITRTLYRADITGIFCTPFDGNAREPVEKAYWDAVYSPVSDALAYVRGTKEIVIVSGGKESSFQIPAEKGVTRKFLQSLQWSPDGEKLLVVVSKCTTACNPGVLILSTEGSVIANVELETYNIIWSPDGRYLLVVLYKGGSGKGVTEPWVIYNLESGESKTLNNFFPTNWAYLQCPLWGNRNCSQ